ncbi:hypothetical protein [Pseudomonas sp. NUPR-001]|uniref:hypothetical protein n=1 Tax=Pseudomonas sp. NUPR-001 TaxID=3416058 RepID=UPI003F972285
MTTYHRLSALSRLLASLHPFSLFQDPDPTLPKPRIPTAEGNGGIRLKDISDPNVPVQVLITAYPQMLVNDTVELFWNGRLVDTRLVTEEHIEQGSVTLNVPSLAIQDGTPPVHYLITSAIGGNVRKSFPLDIRVKTNVPGGTDPIPSTPEVNENLLAVTGVPVLVEDADADRIVATVPPYLNMTEGDRINLSWGGYFVEHLVTAPEVNQPIALPVSRAIIEQAGAGPVVVEYEVRDIVNNWSLWSNKFHVDVEVGAGLLRAPDALDAVDGKLDLDKLGGSDASVRVRSYDGMAEKDEISLSWLGRPPVGGPVEHTDSFTVPEKGDGLPTEFKVPNAIVKASAGGTVAIKYSVSSSRGQQHSKRTSFEVIGEAQRLPAPDVEQAPGDELELDNLPPSGATVRILPYPNMDDGDRLVLFVRGQDANGSPSSDSFPKDITQNEVGEPVYLFVPKAFITPLLDGSLSLHYQVRGNESDTRVLKVVGQIANLTEPSVNGVQDALLDPDTVVSGTQAVVPNYQGKAINDTITLSWAGLAEASFTNSIKVTPDNLGFPISFSVAYTPYIIGNLNTQVRVSYQVQRASGGSGGSRPLTFQVQRQAGENFVPPSVIQAPSGTLDPINALTGATVRVRYEGMLSTDILAVAWTGRNDADSLITDQQPGNAFGSVDFPIPAAIVAASQGKTITVIYAVARNGQPGKPSQELALRVNTLPPSELPKPNVPEAQAGVLDLSTFSGDATITVAPWKLIGAGQRYWISVDATLANGLPYSFYPARAVEVSPAQEGTGLSVPLLRSELEKLAPDSALTITAKVSFDRAVEESAAIIFPVETLKLKASAAGDYLDFSKFIANERIFKGKPRDVGFGWLHCDNNEIQIRSTEIAPFITGNYLFGEDDGFARQGQAYLALHKAATSIRLGVGSFVRIHYVDESGKEYPKVDYASNQWITIHFDKPTKLIYFAAKYDRSGKMQIDNITITY